MTTEGRLLATGIACSLLYIVAIQLCDLWWPETSQILIGMTATNILFGRAAGMSLGYAAGLGHNLVLTVNMIVESLLVLLIYPLFVMSWRRIELAPMLQMPMNRFRDLAVRHHEKIRRYGMAGLFLFVVFPFWGTGPAVGSAIGFILGLRHVVTLTTVLTATFAAMSLWAVVLREMHERVAAYNPAGPMILVLLLILIAVAGQFIYRLQKNHRGSR